MSNSIIDNQRDHPVDPLAEIRRETLLILGYPHGYDGPIAPDEECEEILVALEATVGRAVIRYLNKRARAN